MAIEARDPSTGKVVGVFRSACEAAQIVGTVTPKAASNNIMRCIRQRGHYQRHTAYGLEWREVETPPEMVAEQERERALLIVKRNREMKRRTYERLNEYRDAGGRFRNLVRPGLPLDTIVKMSMAWVVLPDKWKLLEKSLTRAAANGETQRSEKTAAEGKKGR